MSEQNDGFGPRDEEGNPVETPSDEALQAQWDDARDDDGEHVTEDNPEVNEDYEEDDEQ